MKVLVVGNGSRECAIAETLARSPQRPKILAAMKSLNPGIIEICKNTGGDYHRININDPKAVAKLARELGVDFAFVGPEEPLFHGVSDALEETGIPSVGARKKVSIMEQSKAEMRRVMWEYKIPGRLKFKAFKNIGDALDYIRTYPESVALKPARQAGGKGVKVLDDTQVFLHDEKEKVKAEHLGRIMNEYMKDYTDIEDRILIEEKVCGPEYTLQCFTDGKTVAPLPLVQDNKHGYIADIGPETGGMGSISGVGGLLPFITKEERDESIKIVKASVRAIEKKTAEKYHGVIAGQMMITPIWGPTIIEFYSRLGDPEAANVLPILKTDLVEICYAIIEERLNKIKLEFDGRATVVKAVAPVGYPRNRDLARGHPIEINRAAIERAGCRVYMGAIDKVNGKWVTTGSRIAEICCLDKDIPTASERVENCIQYIRTLDGSRIFHREDVGTREQLDLRCRLANMVRTVYRHAREKGTLGATLEWIPGKGEKGKILVQR